MELGWGDVVEVTVNLLDSAELLGLDIAGIDVLFDKNGYKICEANSAPDFKGLESCNDVSIADEIFSAIRRKIEAGEGVNTPEGVAHFEDFRKANLPDVEMTYLSMGMSNSYKVALEEGANLVRIGTMIFGERI